MSRRPDKYPDLDPSQPGIYRRILAAARAMRARQQAESFLHQAAVRAQRVAALAMVNARESDEEPVTVTLPAADPGPRTSNARGFVPTA